MDLVFRAIADPTRREMLLRLVRGALIASELGAGFGMSQPAISQHLKVLRDSGLVRVERVGRQRRYHLEPDGLVVVRDFVRTFEQFWNERLDDLDDVLTAIEDEE